MRKTATVLLLAVIAACGEADRTTTAVAGEEATEAAIELIKNELSDARTLEVSAKLHGQTIEERIDHLAGLLEWFTADETVMDEDSVIHPSIDTAFTLVALDVTDGDPFGDPDMPEMMYGKIHVYTKATVPGAIAHLTDWGFGAYSEDYEVPEELPYEFFDLIDSDELLSVIGCFYLPNELQLPNERVDYWAAAESRHTFVTSNPYFYWEDQYTGDEQNTRDPTGVPVVILDCDVGY